MWDELLWDDFLDLALGNFGLVLHPTLPTVPSALNLWARSTSDEALFGGSSVTMLEINFGNWIEWAPQTLLLRKITFKKHGAGSECHRQLQPYFYPSSTHSSPIKRS